MRNSVSAVCIDRAYSPVLTPADYNGYSIHESFHCVGIPYILYTCTPRVCFPLGGGFRLTERFRVNFDTLGAFSHLKN